MVHNVMLLHVDEYSHNKKMSSMNSQYLVPTNVFFLQKEQLQQQLQATECNPAGISGSVIILWWYVLTPANTYQKYDHAKNQLVYELCCKYQIHKVHVWLGLQGNPPEQFIISCFELTTKTKTLEQPGSLIVPVRTNWCLYIVQVCTMTAGNRIGHVGTIIIHNAPRKHI